MPIETITHNSNTYPHFQSTGNAARFCRAFAQEVCVGDGIDVGANRPEWAYVDRNGKPAIICDPAVDKGCDAMNLPPGKFDYLHSSHATEHFLGNWSIVLDYWQTKLKVGGVIFLYLPDYSQSYWRVWSNRKHIHTFTPQIIKDYLEDRLWKNIFVSGVDLNNSFMAMAEKHITPACVSELFQGK